MSGRQTASPALSGLAPWTGFRPALSVVGSYPRIHLKTRDGDLPDTRVKFWEYPDGGWEAVVIEPPDLDLKDRKRPDTVRSCGSVILIPELGSVIKLPEGCRPMRPEGRCPGLALCDQMMKQAQNARRASTKARRLARANGFRYMTTLTFPRSVDPDRQTRVGLFQKWIAESTGRCLFGKDGYLMFPEPHKSGHFHLHILHSNRLKAGIVRGFWTAFLLRRGHTLPGSSRSVRTHQKDWGSARKAAAYAVKYVSKMFSNNSREIGRRRYYPSRGLQDGMIIRICPPLAETVDLLASPGVYVRYSDPDSFCPWIYLAGDRSAPEIVHRWDRWTPVN